MYLPPSSGRVPEVWLPLCWLAASILFAQVAFSMHCWCLCRLGFPSISSQVHIWVTFPQPTCIPPSVDGVSMPGPELPLQQKLLINKKKQGTSFLMACQMCIKGKCSGLNLKGSSQAHTLMLAPCFPLAP